MHNRRAMSMWQNRTRIVAQKPFHKIPPYIFEIEDLEKNPLPRNLREQNLGGRFIDGVAVLVIRAPVVLGQAGANVKIRGSRESVKYCYCILSLGLLYLAKYNCKLISKPLTNQTYLIYAV